MTLLSQSGLIFAAYLAAGRAGAVAACLLVGISPWETLIIAMLIDLCQIPVYGLIIETSTKHVALPKRFERWIKARSEKLQARIQKKRFWQSLVRSRPIAVIVVATLPFRGFGVLSACILAFMLDFGRGSSTALIMAGSLIGSALSVCVLFFPGRYFGVL